MQKQAGLKETKRGIFLSSVFQFDGLSSLMTFTSYYHVYFLLSYSPFP